VKQRPSSPSLDLKPCSSGHQNVVLDKGRESTLILHSVSLEKENFYGMDIPEAPTLESKRKDYADEHESFSFKTTQNLCLLLESL
jgi:hypothetical protein